MKLVLDLNIDQVNILVNIIQKELDASIGERSDSHDEESFYKQTVYIDNVNTILHQFYRNE